jgi:hypothetical protein
VTILVEDGSGLPVSSATVQGTWSHGISSIATTDANGLATVSSGNVDKSIGSVTFQVTSIAHAILNYDPTANMDSDEPADSDGTSIVVYQDGSTAAPTSTVGENQSTASEPLISGTTSSMTEEPVADDNLFIEQHTAPADEADTEEPVSSASVDEALIDLDLDVLTDQLLDDLALAVL